MSKVELRQLIGEMRGTGGEVRRISHDMDLLMLNGRQIATINKVPGSAIRLLGSSALTADEEDAVMAGVAAERNGVRPSRIVATVRIPGVNVDHDEQETEVDDE